MHSFVLYFWTYLPYFADAKTVLLTAATNAD